MCHAHSIAIEAKPQKQVLAPGASGCAAQRQPAVNCQLELNEYQQQLYHLAKPGCDQHTKSEPRFSLCAADHCDELQSALL